MDSAPAGATRMGSRSSTRHGGPAQVFVGPVRKWRKVWSPITSSSPSPSAARVVLYKWNPLTASNGAVAKDDSATPEAATPPPPRPVKYLPVSVVIQRRKLEIAKEAEAQAPPPEPETQEVKDTSADEMDIVKEPDSTTNQEKGSDDSGDS